MRLQLSPDALAVRFEHEGPSVSTPPNAPCVVPIGEQSRDAYSAVVRRIFREAAPGAVADLVLEVSVSDVQARPVLAGWMAVVEHKAVLENGSGAVVARWEPRGEAMIVGDSAEALPAAFRRAADLAAAQLERDLAASSGVKQLLAARGLDPALAPGHLPARSDRVTYFDVGGALVSGADSMAPGVVARAGVSNQLFMAEAVAGWWTSSFATRPVFGSANGEARMDTWSAGVDVGIVRRVGTVELRGGVGAHVLWGSADLRYSRLQPLPGGSGTGPQETSFPYRQLAPAVFAAIQYADFAFANGMRLRTGLQFRRYFGSSIDFPELNRTVSPAENFFGLVCGVEIPSGPRPPVASREGR